MDRELKIITTEDGSHSLYVPSLNETYHSTRGALTESEHVFIKSGLDFLRSNGAQSIRILEIGFGTGLNAILTQQYAAMHRDISIDYVTLEPFPIPEEIVKALNYQQWVKDASGFEQLHECTWESSHHILENFSFVKHKIALESFDTNSAFDLIYFDAFAPSKQAEIWEVKTLGRATDLLTTGGCLVTYCAQGQFKRDLKTLGLEVQTLDGPPGKKEMVRAIKP